MKRPEIEALARDLEAILERIGAGELEAPAATVYRLEGAIVALRAVLGDARDALVRLLPE